MHNGIYPRNPLPRKSTTKIYAFTLDNLAKLAKHQVA